MNMIRNKQFLTYFGFTLVFAVIYAFTYYPSANDLPKGIHQWGQADRLSICVQYIEGKAFFEPATLSTKSATGSTRVGVELSIFQYAVAQVIKLGFPLNFLPLLYKSLTFILLFVALSAMVNEVLQRESLLIRLATTIFLFSSPVLVYYGYNYLPDIISLALVLIALRLFHQGVNKHIYAIILIAGLATFIKSSSGIYFIAFFSVYFLQNIASRSTKVLTTGVLFLALLGMVAYYDYYYVYLVNKKLWSSVFLSQTVPVKSVAEFFHTLDVAWRFKNDYFTSTQRWVFLLSFIGACIGVRRIGLKHPLTQLCILLAFGLISISVLFGVQLMNHDYYVLCTLFPIIIYATLCTASRYLKYVQPRMSLVLISILALYGFTLANQRYFERNREIVKISGNAEVYPVKWLDKAESKLAPYAKKKDNIFVCYVSESNHSLVYFNRTGATFNAEEMAREESLFWYYKKLVNPTCVILPSKYWEQLCEDQPRVLTETTKCYHDKDLIILHFN